jgi:hypothetical protein
MKLPTKRDLEKKGTQMTKLMKRAMINVRAVSSCETVFLLSRES